MSSDFRLRPRGSRTVHRSLWLAIATIGFSLVSPALSRAEVDYVIHISVDGLRGDVLQRIVATPPNPASTTYPSFRRLQTEGAFTYNARSDYDFTETVPNHITMITGRPVNQPAGQPNTVHHGYSNNFPGGTHTIHANGNNAVPYKASTFDVVHDNGLSTNLYTSKTRLAILDRSYNATNGALDTTGPDNGRDKIDNAQLVDNTSANIVTNLVNSMASTPRNYTFLHLVEPDTVGHASGWENQAWYDSVKLIDDRLSQLFVLIDNNMILRERTAIVLTADHGGGVQVHVDETAYQNYNIPLFVWGADLPAGANLYDLSTNRFDPGLTRPDYNAAQQPWRNGDTGNLALALLGLPPIPGSVMRPELVFVPEPSGALLALGGLVAVRLVASRRRKRPVDL
jgi:hypothetical protein